MLNYGVPLILTIDDELAAMNFTGKRQSQLQLNCIEAIYFPGFSTKIPNHNTQITNNIKIPSSNDQNISITYLMSRCHFICFEFGPFEFVEPALERLDWFKPSSVLEFQLEVIITVRVYSVWAGDLIFGAWYFRDFHGQ